MTNDAYQQGVAPMGWMACRRTNATSARRSANGVVVLCEMATIATVILYSFGQANLYKKEKQIRRWCNDGCN